jgi:hypothetical protein
MLLYAVGIGSTAVTLGMDKMADFHTRSTARSMLNYANQLATMLHRKAVDNGVDTRSEVFTQELCNRWEPAYNRAVQFCRDNGINPKYI